MTSRDLIVFDMDGVLVEVTESYRETIRQTVHHFTGQAISYDRIQDYKNAGGWNNDWALSQRMAADLGVQVDYQTVVAHFQKLFLGDGGNGLILRERWIARDRSLHRLAERFDLAIFTGRPRYEAQLTLSRFAADLNFDPLVTDDDVQKGKPDPEGLRGIVDRNPGRTIWYVGDTVDDARCARAAEVPFIGVASQAHSSRDRILELFASERAVAVLEDINFLENFLANRAARA